MKLRNKKTGEIGEAYWVTFREDGTDLCVSLHENGTYEEVHSLAELNEDWEDYKPTEPLIRDEKIRKAVRAWAEANNAKVVFICALSGGWGVRHDWKDDGKYYSIDLLFKGDAPLGVGNQYTIAELCGEEEE